MMDGGPWSQSGEELRQIRHHRFLQFLLWIALMSAASWSYFLAEPGGPQAAAYAALCGLFLVLEVVRSVQQTMLQPRFLTTVDAVNVLLPATAYSVGVVTWLVLWLWP